MKTVLYFIFGCSATGKSTRVYHLIQFLDSRSEKWEPLIARGKVIGRHYVDRNLSIVGKEVVFKGIKKWQGLDIFTGVFGSNEVLFRWIYDHTRTSSLIIEGAGTILSHRARPEVLEKELDPETSCQFLIYEFPNFSDYQKRIADRSGYDISEDTPMWQKNRAMKGFGVKIIAEAKLTPTPSRYHLEMNSYDSDVKGLGRTVLGVNLEFENFPVVFPKPLSEERNLF